MKKTVFVIVLLMTTLISAAEGYPYQIKQLTMRDNLAHYSVLSLYQDPRGMVWMGTRNGVSIYDGNQLHLYRHEQGSANSLPSNYVRQITGDGKQQIYLLTLREVGFCSSRYFSRCFKESYHVTPQAYRRGDEE